MAFFERWCDRCRAEPDCPIIAATMLYEMTDPEYPKEWVADDAIGNGARCTAFEAEVDLGALGDALRGES